MWQEFSLFCYSDGFVTWIGPNIHWLLVVTGVMHEADDAYSIRSTWSCYWLDQFLTLALSTLILSVFYISLDLSTIYFTHFGGCWASFLCDCHSILECCVVFSGVKLSIRSFNLFIIIIIIILKMRPSWQTLSNAFEMSRKTALVSRDGYSWKAVWMLWVIYKSWLIVESRAPGRKPDWFGVISWLSVRCS